MSGRDILSTVLVGGLAIMAALHVILALTIQTVFLAGAGMARLRA